MLLGKKLSIGKKKNNSNNKKKNPKTNRRVFLDSTASRPAIKIDINIVFFYTNFFYIHNKTYLAGVSQPNFFIAGREAVLSRKTPCLFLFSFFG